ncbi:O-antigen ligase family protein [Priestia filamentosa]|uniref:O-antigen ligase family protein n=1 Tax=Priestia filamentosa TaxID=1402861 RepID=UPI00397DA029
MKKQQSSNRGSFFLMSLWMVMAASGIVIFEPAPIDLGITFLFIVGILFARISIRNSLSSLYMLLFALIITNLIPLLMAGDKIIGIKYFAVTLYLMLSWLFFIGLVNVYGEKAIKVIFSGYTFAALLSAILGILAYLSLIPSGDMFLKYGRATGLFKDPNVYGPFMIPIVLYALVKLEDTKKSYKFWWIWVIILASFAILLSYSRAAWGSYVAALIVYSFIRFWMKPNIKLIISVIVMGGVIAIGLMYLLSIPQIQKDMASRFAYQEYDNDRFAHQDEALNIALGHPLGKGPGQSELVLNYATHNSYLRVWLENGYFGLLFYLSLIIFSIFRGIRYALKTKNSLYALAVASIVAVVINSFVVDVVHWRHFWLVLSIPWFAHPSLFNKVINEPVNKLTIKETGI